MVGRASLVRAEPGFSLPFFDRLAPPPPPGLVAARIEAHSKPGDIVLDLAGRGGWIGRAAVDRQRRAVSLESTPLTRLLAELVLRPPDLRHLDAAFQAMSASPRGQTSLKVAVGEPFTTRCATCGRTLPLDEVVWPGAAGPDDVTDLAEPFGSGSVDPAREADAPRDGSRSTRHADRDHPMARKFYACPVCRGLRGGEQRNAGLDAADLERSRAIPADYVAVRARLAERFPVLDGGVELVDGLLDLHTPRQLVGLEAILDRIEGDLRAAPVEAALRLAFVHALLPASRLNGYPGRIGTLRIQAGHVRPPSAGQWRERHPWLAFEDGIRTVRGFIQRLESGPGGAVQARLGTDLRALDEGSATAVVGVSGPSTMRAIGEEASLGRGWDGSSGGPGLRRRIRLVLGQPPVRPNQERLSLTYWATAWAIGSEAASGLPLAALSGPPIRAPWGWQAASLARSLASIEPSIARDGQVIELVDGGSEALVAAAIGGVGAGFRLLAARLGDGDDEAFGSVELIPPGAALPPGPRTRANVSLDPVAGGSGDPDIVPGAGLFGAPERFDRRSFSAADVRNTVVEVAVESLKARGEPASADRLLGEILVGLDRAGQLRRLVADRAIGSPDRDREARPDPADSLADPAAGTPPATPAPDPGAGRDGDRSTAAGGPASAGDSPAPAESGSRATAEGARLGPTVSTGAADQSADRPTIAARRGARSGDAPPDQVESLLALIGEGLSDTGRRRLAEVAPGRWWLADAKDRETAAAPLADRVEWAVFSLLSTAGPMSETSFLQRIASLFVGHDLPDETLVRACLQSYRSRASTADRIVTGDDLLRRAQEHAELIGLLADGGHRLGLSVWIGRREQARRLGAGRLADRLHDAEQRAPLSLISRAVAEVAEIDCAWYIRGKLAFLFEVEWTAMLGEPILRRHSRIPQDDGTVRFLVVAPERTELVRHKIERSPLLREAFDRDNWHVLKWNHLRAFLAKDDPDLEGLEPYLGLDPIAERSGDQLDLFGA